MKAQVASIFGFASHTASAITPQLCPAVRVVGQAITNGRVRIPIKLFTQGAVAHGLGLLNPDIAGWGWGSFPHWGLSQGLLCQFTPGAQTCVKVCPSSIQPQGLCTSWSLCLQHSCPSCSPPGRLLPPPGVSMSISPQGRPPSARHF